MMFRDRVDAGRRLAFALRRYRDETPVVLGLPRGGVPVAYEVARALKAPLDIWVVRKIGAPGHEELGMGAISEGGDVFLNDDVLAEVGASPEQVEEMVSRKAAEVEARVQRFRRGRPPPELEGRTAIVVDDGIATGGTVHAVLRAVRRRRPKRLILAVPVASPRALAALRPEVDEIVCLEADPYLFAIGAYYQDFTQTTDDDVIALLDRARGGDAGADSEAEQPAISPGEELAVEIEIDDARLAGTLTIPAGTKGLVLFAHGSGSSRHSPRNRLVAGVLQDAGIATLLLDLLTAEEEAVDDRTGHLRFDVELLAGRVLGAALATRELPETSALRLGYFGASTGAAAALIAAAQRPDLAGAVVSRGGRPDLAGAFLEEVVAPTLLLVGGEDTEVLALNRRAYERLRGPRELVVVEGATHLFEEPGTLDEVARAASAWFVRYLAPQALEATA
ncbi:phosphoribosyl transferase [Sorangium cellulosum]|uniref:Phosphoribosyl transferase n=1 Tax=Sorangium cellulosum TaxID=56 RepID=A0A4P2QCJ0_SORCE|nr:phosphoribosyltransferase family protein [Sorangium cellulosum]AUX26843.1 phosphoribosyl transferase [Sorangium cellulosum]